LSTILKALHRLERDKEAQEGRPLREQVMDAPARRREWPSWPVAGATLTAGIAVGAAVLLLWAGSWPETPESGQEAETEQSQPQASAASARRGEAERSWRARAAERRAKRRAERAEGERSQPQASAQRGEAERSQQALRTPGSRPPAEAGGGAAARRAEAEANGPRPLENASPEAGFSEPPALSLAARPGGGEALSSEAGSESAGLPPDALASRVELVDRIETSPRSEEPEGREGIPEAPPPVVPARLRRAPVPDVFVARTVWHPVAERRVAEVEVRGRPEPLRLHEGDAVGPLVVGRIEPSGVVFLHEQVELRRRVGVR
jgi:hypothetical protein